MSSERIKELAISDSGFLFDPFSGGTFTLNETGQVILKALKDGLTQPEIVAKLTSDFEQVSSRVEEDVQDFLRALNELGLTASPD